MKLNHNEGKHKKNRITELLKEGYQESLEDRLMDDTDETEDDIDDELEEFDDELENDLELEFLNDKESTESESESESDSADVSESNAVEESAQHNKDDNKNESVPDETVLEEEYREEMEELDTAATDEYDRKKKEMHKNRSYNNRMNRKRRQQKRIIMIGLLAAAVLMVVILIGYLIGRMTPTKEKYDAYKYFDVSSSDAKVLVMIDQDSYADTGVNIDGQLYLPQEFVEQRINPRFYYDKESDSILYTDTQAVYSFLPNDSNYSSSLGQNNASDFPVFKKIDQENYVNFEFVAKYTNINYVYASNPSRLVITTIKDELSYVDVKKNSQVRFRAGIKSKILEQVSKDDRLVYVSTIDDWTEVVTPSGFTGYIKTSCLSDVYNERPENTFIDKYAVTAKDYKINMTWYQATNMTANNNIGQYIAAASGLNTISPTWYSISGETGEVTSIASSEFVNSMHARGLEVWPLINDFDKDISYANLFSSKAARTNLINKLISDAVSYSYDGINLDFENIKADYAADYLQFVRELSIRCKSNGIVLSIDNYKPESYNSFYNLKEQSVFADYVIIMGYDEHYSGSEAGSVASLPFVKDGIEDALTMVPNEQLINAIPFYTRIWTVSGTNTSSKAVGMQAAIDDMSSSGEPALWDDNVGQFFGSYEKNGALVKIWFEEERSIEEKMKLIKENNLAGVSSWKLGMEKDSVWSIINSYLQ